MNQDLGQVFMKSVIHMDWMSLGTWMFNQTFVSKLKRQHYVKHCAVRKFLAYYRYGNSQQIPAYFVLASELKENPQATDLEHLVDRLEGQGTRERTTIF